MHSPFFFKQSFYLPTATNASKNAANLKYIATRPGADRGDLEPEIPEAERDPRERSIEDDFGPVKPGTAAGHVRYMDERPGSHGLFDADGVASLKDAMDEVLNNKGIVWRDVVSLHEDDATRLGYTTREAWEDALRRSMPDVAKAMGIREDNLRWVAAFHQKEGHPHCHVSIWEKNPERSRGVITDGMRRNMRKAYMDVIYEHERACLYLEKNMIRDLLRDQTGQELKGLGLRQYLRESKLEAEAERGGPPGLVPVLDDETRAQLQGKLEALAQAMPGHGRIALKYMPEEVKTKVRETADWLLRQPGFADQAGRFAAINRELAGTYTKQETTLYKATLSAGDDIRDRVAQVLLKGAAEIRKSAEFDRENPVHMLLKFAHGEIDREVYHIDPLQRQDLLVPGDTAVIRESLEKLAERLKSPGDVVPEAAGIADRLLQTMDYYSRLAGLNPEAARTVRDGLAEQALVAATRLNRQQQGDMPPDYTCDKDKVAQAIERLKNATADFVKRDPKEAEWVAGTMYRALIVLGTDRDEARQDVLKWASGAGVDVSEKLVKMDYWFAKLEGTEKNVEDDEDGSSVKKIPFVVKSSWYRMAHDLDIPRDEIIYPALWQPPEKESYVEVRGLLRDAHSAIDIRVYRLDPTKRQGMVEPENISELNQELVDLAEHMKHPGDVTGDAKRIAGELLDAGGYVKTLYELDPEAARAVQEALSEQVIGAAARMLQKQEQAREVTMVLDEGKAAEARGKINSANADYVRYDESEARWTAKAMYRTLTMMGSDKDEARSCVVDWAQDTGLDTWQLDKQIIAYDKKQEERGKHIPSVAGRKYWARLERNLNLEPGDLVYPWVRVQQEQRTEDRDADARYLTRYAWGEIDQEVYRLDPGQRQGMVSPDEFGIGYVTDSLEKLADLIPEDVQRPDLAYMPAPVQEEAYAITDYLLSGNYYSGLARLSPEAAHGVRDKVAEQVVSAAAGIKRDREPGQALKNIEMRPHFGRIAESLEALKGADADLVRINPEETAWTARTMYRTLVKLGTDRDEAKQTVVKWSRGTGVDAGQIISRYEEQQAGRTGEQIAAEPVIIGRRAWSRLAKNLNLEDKMPYAWFGFVDDPEKKQPDIRFHIDDNQARNAIQTLRGACLSPRVRQEQDWTLRAYAATLHALGVGEAERTQMLRDWSRESGANIPDAKIRDISERLSLSTDNNFCLGRENWERLTGNLGVSVKNPFVFERSNASIVRDVWKGAFRAVERERQKAEARGKMEKMKEAKKRERKEKQHQQGKYREERENDR